MPAGIIGGVGSIASGVIGSDAASGAAQAAKNAQQANNAAANSVYQTNTSNLQPYVNTGQSANGALAGLLGVGGNAAQSNADFQNYLNSTNYKFQLGQGEQAIDTANAPAFNSGATAKALNNYAQGQAGSALSAYEGQLSGLSNTGLQGASTLGSLGTQYASQIASNNNNAASIEGQAGLIGANAITGALGGLTSAYGSSSFGSSNPFSSFGSGGVSGTTTITPGGPSTYDGIDPGQAGLI